MNAGQMSAVAGNNPKAPRERAMRLRRVGNQLLQNGEPTGALDCFTQALLAFPADENTLCDRGNALQDLGRHAEALECYTQALGIRPQFAAALLNRGNALRALRRCEQALADVDAALMIKPAFVQALNSRGNILRDLARVPEAVVCYEAALALDPTFLMARCNLGNALLDLDRAREALACFEAVLKVRPADGKALFGRASALLHLQEGLEQSLADFARAASCGIDRIEVLVGQAAVLARLERHSENLCVLAELQRVAPERDYARGAYLNALLQTVSWSALEPRMAELEVRIQEGRRATHPQALLSLSESAALQWRCARVFADEHYPVSTADEFPARGDVRARAARPIRIAYLSSDFGEHPVSHLLVGVLEQHDRRAVEVLGVSLYPCGDAPFAKRVWAAFERFVDLSDRHGSSALSALRELEIDIAVDLNGYTVGGRPGLFARRIAPVQVNYLGYAGTLGAPYMDYVLADEVVIPAGEERWYSEQVVRLPHCYLPTDDRRPIGPRPTRAQAGLPESGFVYCAFTNAYKINPPVFAVWMRLLDAVTGSVLWLRAMGEEARSNLLREAERYGIAPERLVFAPRVASMADHLARQSLADLYLDTLPYNAHSTACDALWAGVPVLSCAGQSFASRVAASALTAAGLPELVTHSLAEYEQQALALAQQPARLAELRTRLATQRSSVPLFNTALYTRHLEQAFHTMHERVIRGQNAAAFRVITQDL